MEGAHTALKERRGGNGEKTMLPCERRGVTERERESERKLVTVIEIMVL